MKTIIEVGAYEGAETLHFLDDAEAEVYAFEPDDRKFSLLHEKFRPYSCRATILPFAVGLCDNQEALFNKEGGMSTIQPDLCSRDTWSMVWSIRLDTFCRLYGITKVDYLRIDAPFSELDCLDSMVDRIASVARGRIRCYGEKTEVPAWLLDHGFSIEPDFLPNLLEKPDLRFWRNP